MATQGLNATYNGNFEQFLEENRKGQTLQEALSDAFISYSPMFQEPFFNIEDTSVPMIDDEELYRWVSWCIFYGRPRNEYPEAKLS